MCSTDSQSASFENTPTHLLRGAKQGDQRALDELLDWFQPYVMAILHNYGLPDAEKREVFQNVFLSLLGWLPGFERQRAGSFRRYLERTARSRVFDFWRDQKKWRLGANDSAVDWDGVADPFGEESDEDPVLRARIALVHRELERLLPTLSPVNQEAFRRVYLYHEPPPIVQQELGLTADGMYQSFRRFLRRLRAAIGDQPLEDGDDP